jgi:hypothetical protein
MSNYNQSPLALNEWHIQRPNGDVALCDPFTGVPFKEQSNQDSVLSLDVPPPIFAHDDEANLGYLLWRNSGGMTDYRLHVNVLVTDPSSPEGLGDPDELLQLMDGADCVGFSTKRSVFRGEMQRRTVPSVGGMTLASEVMQNDPYVQAVRATAKSSNVRLFNFDPPADPFGKPATSAGRNLEKVEDMVRIDTLRLEDMENPDDAFTASDLVYCNMLEWLKLSQSGRELDRFAMDAGEYPDTLLLLLPAELGGFSDKLGSLGVSQATDFAHEGLRNQEDYLAYPYMINAGLVRQDFAE